MECWKKVLSENFGSVSRHPNAIRAQSSSLFTSTPFPFSIRRWFALLGDMSNPNLAEVMGDGPASIADKLTLLPGYEPDFSAVTFCLKEEDHTLGNSLRYMIMKE